MIVRTEEFGKYLGFLQVSVRLCSAVDPGSNTFGNTKFLILGDLSLTSGVSVLSNLYRLSLTTEDALQMEAALQFYSTTLSSKVRMEIQEQEIIHTQLSFVICLFVFCKYDRQTDVDRG